MFSKLRHPYTSRITPSPSPSFSLLHLPPDLLAYLCTFLALPDKFLLLSRLSHSHSKLLTSHCFRHDHVHLTSDIMSRIQSVATTTSAVSLLSHVQSLTVDIHHPRHNYSLLSLPFTLALSPPFPSPSLSFLSITVDQPDLYKDVATVLRALPGLRQLHLDVGGSRIPFPVSPFPVSLPYMPVLKEVKLKMLLARAQLSELLALPALTALDLSECELEDPTALRSALEATALREAMGRLQSLSLPPVELNGDEDGDSVDATSVMGIKDVLRTIAATSSKALQRLRVDGRFGPLSVDDLLALPRLEVVELHEWKRNMDAEVPMLSPLDAFPSFTTSSCLLRRPSHPASPAAVESLDDDCAVTGARSLGSVFHVTVVDLQVQSTSLCACLQAVQPLGQLQKLRVRKPVHTGEDRADLALPDTLALPSSLHTLTLENLGAQPLPAHLFSFSSHLVDGCFRRCPGFDLETLLAVAKHCRALRRLQVISCAGLDLSEEEWTRVRRRRPDLAEFNTRQPPFPALRIFRLDFSRVPSTSTVRLQPLVSRLQSSPLTHLTLLHPRLTSAYIVALSSLPYLRSLRIRSPLEGHASDLHLACSMYYDGVHPSVETSGLFALSKPASVRYTEPSRLRWSKESLEDRGVFERERLSEAVMGLAEMETEALRDGTLVYDRVFCRQWVREGMDGRTAFFHDLHKRVNTPERSCCVC